MRLFLLENFVDHEFDVTNKKDKEDLIAFAKKHCSKALNEFYKTNNYLFRGISGIDDYSAYVIPTKQKRVPFGTTTKGKTGESFNKWLEDNGHARRDKNVAFTTTSKPENYKGIHNDEWFFFIPIGDYHYTYINTNEGGDFNLHPWVQQSLGSLYDFEISLNELDMHIHYSTQVMKNIRRDNPDTDFKKFTKFRELEKKLFSMNRNLQQYIMDVSMIFQKGIFSNNNLEELKEYMKKIPVFLQEYETLYYNLEKTAALLDTDDHSDEYEIIYSSECQASVTYPIEGLTDIQSFMNIDNTFGTLDALLKSIVSDKITPYFKNNEVFIECDLYLVVPYKLGYEFIDKLVY